MTLDVRSLSVRYPDAREDVLSGLDFTVKPGQFVLIDGPSGSGKSTLGRVLSGLIPRRISARLSGNLRIGDLTPTISPIRETARQVVQLLQNVEAQLFTGRPEDEIVFALENRALDPARIAAERDRLLQTWNLESLMRRSFATLSMGERQRAALAALMTSDAPLLLLDEPLAFLDENSARSLLALLRIQADKGRTVILFEHRHDLAAPFVDQVMHLREKNLYDTPLPAFDWPTVTKQSVGDIVLNVRQATITFDGHSLLSEVSFALHEREALLLLGDNGSGKTSLLRAIMGLDTLSDGDIHLAGIPAISGRTRRLAAKAALVLQNPDAQLHLSTVREEVELGAKRSKDTDAELEAFGLRDLADRHPQTLSVGQKRRVTLAAALARRPLLLLLDEPTVGQDDANLARMLERLDTFVREGGALICATHDTRFVEAIRGKLLRLENGRARLDCPD